MILKWQEPHVSSVMYSMAWFKIIKILLQFYNQSKFLLRTWPKREKLSDLTEKWGRPRCKSFSIASQWEPFQSLGIQTKLLGLEKYEFSHWIYLFEAGTLCHHFYNNIFIDFPGAAPMKGNEGISFSQFNENNSWSDVPSTYICGHLTFPRRVTRGFCETREDIFISYSLSCPHSTPWLIAPTWTQTRQKEVDKYLSQRRVVMNYVFKHALEW